MNRTGFNVTMLGAALLLGAALTGCQPKDGSAGAGLGSILIPGSTQSTDGDYSILLYVVTTPDHVDRIKTYKQRTETETGWKDLFIVQESGYSELYWGKYTTPDAAENHLKKAKAYRTPVGIAVYEKARLVPIPGKHIGPDKWGLQEAKGAYTVVVASFYDVPEQDYYGRKHHAVAYCTQLREKGERAFYHHGASISTVTVGEFPDSAVKKVHDARIKKADTIRYIIHEPGIDAIVRRYKYLAVNGYQEIQTIVDPKTRQAKKVIAKPYPAHIPGDKDTSHAQPLYRLGDAK